MAEKTGILWTEATWNPTVGCSLVSPGCTRCYAMKVAHRNASKGAVKYEGLTRLVKGEPVWNGVVRIAGERALNEIKRWKTPKMIFVNSMSDLWHESLALADIFGIIDRMVETDRHVYQVLTKRPARMAEGLALYCESRGRDLPEHIWWGTSVEDQIRADERIPILARIPAKIRFVSMEPLQERVALDHLPAVEWYIVGGESVERPTPREKAAPFDEAWAVDVLDYTRRVGAAFIMKQTGSNRVGGMTIHPKGGDDAEWQERLRVAEFPARLPVAGPSAPAAA